MVPTASYAPPHRSLLASFVSGLRAHGAAVAPEPDLTPALALPDRAATLEERGRFEQEIEDAYGPSAGKELLVAWGRERFNTALREFAAQTHKHRVAALVLPLPLLPLELRLRLVLRLILEDANRVEMDAARFEEHAGWFLVVDDACSCRYRVPHDAPCCFATLGLIARAVEWAGGRADEIREVSCRSAGADACRFLIPTRPADSCEEAADSL